MSDYNPYAKMTDKTIKVWFAKKINAWVIQCEAEFAIVGKFAWCQKEARQMLWAMNRNTDRTRRVGRIKYYTKVGERLHTEEYISLDRDGWSTVKACRVTRGPSRRIQ